MAARRAAVAWLAIVAVSVLAGCRGVQRATVDTERLLVQRDQTRELYHAVIHERFEAVLAQTHRELMAYRAGKRATAPTIDVLCISGGGDWGAFGVGFLKGWRSVPRDHPLALPEFDTVTGVSTGALIAPFAFIGDEEAMSRIEYLYRHPQPDWTRERGLFFFLPHYMSFRTTPGLERDLRESIDLAFAERIAEAGASGRMLAVNTTNLDDASPRVFSLVLEAQRAVQERDMTRMHNIILASAGIPGAFPYREIDGTMYVDGGVTANIIYGGRLREGESLPALWKEMYPGEAMPTLRYWVLFNNKLRTLPRVVPARWPAIVTRSLELSIRSSTLTSIRHLYAMAHVYRLAYGAQVEVRVVAIPDGWTPPNEGEFDSVNMNELVDMGERMGADPEAWILDLDDF